RSRAVHGRPGRTRRAERRAEQHCGLPTLSPVPSASRRAARRPRPCPPSNPRRRTTRPTGDTTDRPEWLCPSLNRGGGLSSLPALLPPSQSDRHRRARGQCHSSLGYQVQLLETGTDLLIPFTYWTARRGPPGPPAPVRAAGDAEPDHTSTGPPSPIVKGTHGRDCDHTPI